MEHKIGTKPYVLHGIREELLEQLEMRKWSHNDLSRYSGLTAIEIGELMGDNPAISNKVAEALSRTFAMSVTHWLDLGRNRE